MLENFPNRKLVNIHPGEILKKELLEPLGISSEQLAKAICINIDEINDIINEKKGIKIEIASKLSEYFGNSAKFWLGLQNDYDLEKYSKKSI